MKILCLYNNECALELFEWMRNQNNECVLWNEELSTEWVRQHQFDLAVSYTYSKIIKMEIIDELNGNIVNLHTSYLPWNRGVDPNMWSLIDQTPRGVTLHYIDNKLDKGFVIAQEMVPCCDLRTQTLKSSYDMLHEMAVGMFKKAFYYYDYWQEMKKQTLGKGTYHTDKQGVELRKHITSFDMPVLEFLEEIRK